MADREQGVFVAGEIEVITLYRPVGRGKGQIATPNPLRFYPVANEEYATQIARDWNTRDEASGFTGYVLRFRVPADFLSQYPLRTAGAAIHQEYWIPSEELDAFNAQIDGQIETVSRFQLAR